MTCIFQTAFYCVKWKNRLDVFITKFPFENTSKIRNFVPHTERKHKIKNIDVVKKILNFTIQKSATLIIEFQKSEN